MPERISIKQKIVKLLYAESRLSIFELSRLIGVSVPSVTKALFELKEQDFIVDFGLAVSTGGRRAQIYGLKSNILFVVSVTMNQLQTTILITDLLNSPLLPAETFKIILKDSSAPFDTLTDLINNLISRCNISRDRILGVGIGIPGFMNKNLGINYSFVEPNSGLTMIAYLQNKLQLPVYIENDSSLVALAELKFGKARSISQAMVINIGWGVGLGVIVNGSMMGGATGFAGELSHIPISGNDILCDCGKRGCLETEASLKAITSKALELIKEGNIKGIVYDEVNDDKSEVIMFAANKGDQFAIDLLTDMGFKIGKALAILVHIINPELIVLSGPGAKVGRILIAPIQQALNKDCVPKLSESIAVQISSFGPTAELMGAAALVVENLASHIFESSLMDKTSVASSI